jgi:hypothetical protein
VEATSTVIGSKNKPIPKEDYGRSFYRIPVGICGTINTCVFQ